MAVTSGPSTRPRPGGEVVSEVARCFDAAAERRTTSVIRVLVAGATLELRTASPALHGQLARAFGHLPASSSPARASDLTVFLWDGTSAESTPAPFADGLDDPTPGASYHLDDPPVRVVHMPGIPSMSVLDAGAGKAWYWVGDAGVHPYWERAAPIRLILTWWLETRGYLVLHGAAVGRPDGGVLIVGRGGSGKSTLALSCLASDLFYAGDDYVAVGLQPAPVVHSLYTSGKLEPPHLREKLPHLLERISNCAQLETEKAVLYAHEHFPERMSVGFPLRAVIVPRLRTGRSAHEITEVSRAATFAALAPSTVLQLRTPGSFSFETMAQLVQRVPCVGLEIGSDVAAGPAAIQRVLEYVQAS